ncbi:MAG: sensor histidine kinase [Bacillota bacterium]|jgi:signal transduction histidine kinase
MAMQGIMDRLLILACCSALLVGKADDVTAVVAMLAATTVSALNGYSRSKTLLIASIASYTVASMVWPAFCLFLPLVYYDAMAQYHATGKIAWLIAGAVSLVVSFTNLHPNTWMMAAALMAVTYVLALHTTAVERSQTEAKRLRDSGYEMSMLLRQKNQELIEKQDYEIRLATLNERARIAREIHDHVGHLLSRSILQVGALMVTKDNEEERQSLEVVRDTLSQAMDRIRASVHDLHDESLDLRTKVESLVREFTFCPIRLDYRLDREPEKGIAYCFIAVIKEGLSNIIRHSNATQVTLTLLEHPALYQLVLQDNGTQKSGVAGQFGRGRSAAPGFDQKEGLSSIIVPSQSTSVSGKDHSERPVLCRTVPSQSTAGVEKGHGETPALHLTVSSHPAGAVEKGLGLRSMTDRVEALGGRLTIEHSGGFRIFISIPKSSYNLPVR